MTILLLVLIPETGLTVSFVNEAFMMLQQQNKPKTQ